MLLENGASAPRNYIEDLKERMKGKEKGWAVCMGVPVDSFIDSLLMRIKRSLCQSFNINKSLHISR